MPSSLELLKYRDPSQMDYRAHVAHVRQYNQAIQQEVSAKLEARLTGLRSDLRDPENFAIFTMGSDGRLEKGPVSPIELAVYATPEAQNTPDNALLIRSLADIGAIHLIDEDIEHRRLDENRLSYVNMRPPDKQERVSVASPGRVFDATLIFGAPELYSQMVAKVYAEARAPKEGRKLFDRMSDKADDHAEWFVGGVQPYQRTTIRHYTPHSGEVFYDDIARKYGFKQGPMRAIQFALVRDALREIRAGADTDIVMHLPKHTSDKLRSIDVRGWTKLSSSAMTDLSDCYDWFLWGYHRSQWAHRKGMDMILLDSAEMTERLNTVSHILSMHNSILSLSGPRDE